MDKKEQQKPLSIEEQISNLRTLNLLIEDENYAKEILNNISYYRLIKAYGIEFKDKNSNYLTGTKFETIVSLYKFNSELCHIIFDIIEKIEIILRCRISNYFSLNYGVLGYKNVKNFDNSYYYEEFLMSVNEELERNDKSPIVKNFRNKYLNGELPFYALIELFSFGTLSKFYKNMLSKDKKEIAKTFCVPYTFLESWIESMAFVRNCCAHYGRLYNEKLPKKPMLYKEDKIEGSDNDRLFTVLQCISRIVKHDNEWNLFKNNLNDLFLRFNKVNLKYLGIPNNWKTYL